MVKSIKKYSGRSGARAYDVDGKTVLPISNRSASVGEKTTVRSGAASSKTYITPKVYSPDTTQYYVAKTNSKSAKKKK